VLREISTLEDQGVTVERDELPTLRPRQERRGRDSDSITRLESLAKQPAWREEGQTSREYDPRRQEPHAAHP
jgi:hypothetical protein